MTHTRIHPVEARARLLGTPREEIAKEVRLRGVECARSTVGRVLNGDLRPSRRLAEAIADVFALPVEEAFVLDARGRVMILRGET